WSSDVCSSDLRPFLTKYFECCRNRSRQMIDLQDLPVAVIGAGPIGLAAAAHLVERGMEVRIYEAGTTVGTNVRDWTHVQIFTTWEQSVDAASVRLLEKHNWTAPQSDRLP